MKNNSFLSKTKYAVLMLLTSCFGSVKSRPDDSTATKETNTANMPSIYSFQVKTLDGKTIDFSQYKGKKLLIVNTASKCGFTHQYEDLEKLNKQHGDKVTILGFPCNDFGAQEPGTNEEIGAFCQKNYGVSFQMFDKVDVKGEGKAPIYVWLTDKNKNGWNDKEPSWNFCKYLINEKGELVNFFGSSVEPMGKEMLDAINK